MYNHRYVLILWYNLVSISSKFLKPTEEFLPLKVNKALVRFSCQGFVLSIVVRT